MSADCVFCKIICGEIPSRKVYENEHCIVILDIAEDVDGHMVALPKNHVKNIFDCDKKTLHELTDTVKLVSKHLVDHCGYDGVNLLNANDESAGQSVPHFHIHIIPRKRGDHIDAWPAFEGAKQTLNEVFQKVKYPTASSVGIKIDNTYKHLQVNAEVKLLRADVDDAKELQAMQVEAFKELLEKYQDFDTNPGNESVEKVRMRLKQDFTYFYFICLGTRKAGAIRIVDRKEAGKNKRISPIFVLPEFQGKGIAQRAIQLCEKIHGSEDWELDTILQEPKNCHLYEKMGYRQSGKTEVINEKLTLVFYGKKGN